MNPKSQKMSRFFGWLLLTAGVFFFTVLIAKEGRLIVFGKKATAQVQSVKKVQKNNGEVKRNNRGTVVSRRGPSISHVMHLTYKTQDGADAAFDTSATFNTEARVGDVHPIVYLPSDPSKAKIATMRQLWLPATVGLTVSLTCLAVGWFLLRLSSLPSLA
jgi:hypothetical protein